MHGIFHARHGSIRKGTKCWKVKPVHEHGLARYVLLLPSCTHVVTYASVHTRKVACARCQRAQNFYFLLALLLYRPLWLDTDLTATLIHIIRAVTDRIQRLCLLCHFNQIALPQKTRPKLFLIQVDSFLMTTVLFHYIVSKKSLKVNIKLYINLC